jgi:hypothetical protein
MRVPMEAHPTKCVFGVSSGLLLGFMVGHRGIEANTAKVDTIRKMDKPSNKKDVMKLTVMITALGRFISKLGEKGLPFFKLFKKVDKFVWDDEAQKAFEALKESLTTPPIMTLPIPKETLLLYISATTNVVSTVLIAEREEEGGPILFSDMCITLARSWPTLRHVTHNLKSCSMRS